ncbi:TPA: hypothetical protein ACH3X3_003834 [Trebouxia sp. C0006]
MRSHKLIWWQCHECPKGKVHSWQARPAKRTSSKRSTGCPSGAGKKPCDCNSLETVCPDIAADFDVEKNGVTAAEVTSLASTKYSWLSDEPGAKKRSVDQRTSNVKKQIQQTFKSISTRPTKAATANAGESSKQGGGCLAGASTSSLKEVLGDKLSQWFRDGALEALQIYGLQQAESGNFLDLLSSRHNSSTPNRSRAGTGVNTKYRSSIYSHFCGSSWDDTMPSLFLSVGFRAHMCVDLYPFMHQ